MKQTKIYTNNTQTRTHSSTTEPERKREVRFNYNKIVSIQARLASAETIRSWSRGDVKNTETINYRTLKAEPGGLFCEKIFGPMKDYECACGKHKKSEVNAGIICDKCGVEVTSSLVRCQRFSHIELGIPVVHTWMLRVKPSYIANVLNMLTTELEEVTYYISHVVLDPGNSKFLTYKLVLTRNNTIYYFFQCLQEIKKNAANLAPIELSELNDYLTVINNIRQTTQDLPNVNNTDTNLFIAYNFNEIANFIEQHLKAKFGIGAKAIETLLKNVDLKKELSAIVKQINACRSQTDMAKLIQRQNILQNFINGETKPEWMVMNVIPVIPPGLRPIVQIDGGRFTSSDFNELYRRVIIRKNRLQRIMSQNAPTIIVYNEKRMLQEAVDALFDNQRKPNPFLARNGRPLKSITDNIKGKQGRFRQNLLGKRVDYSARSVIVGGPELKMYECGLPRDIAIVLYKPFIVAKLLKDGYVKNINVAKRIVDRKEPVAWKTLEQIINDRPVLLNRAPTLHRQGIQAFEPRLIKGRAIHLHPLATAAFNADFDGDQMAVHLPLSDESINEARSLLIGSKNILSLSSGKPIATPSLDMVLGIYFLTQEIINPLRHQIPIFASCEVARLAYENKQLTLHEPIVILTASILDKIPLAFKKNKYLLTTLGKAILNLMLPAGFPYINRNLDANAESFGTLKTDYLALSQDIKAQQAQLLKQVWMPGINKNSINKIVAKLFLSEEDRTYIYLDRIKNLGFTYASQSAVTAAISDLNLTTGTQNQILNTKKTLIQAALKKIHDIETLYADGYLNHHERHRHIISIWEEVRNKVESEVQTALYSFGPKTNNSFFLMVDSGARGSISNITQLAGMRGLMTSTKGDIIEIPIRSSFIEGVSMLEFFISTHGSRKGLSDTALKTADAGFLTRRLVDAVNDVIVLEHDCQTTRGIIIRDIYDTKTNSIIMSLREQVTGRFVIRDLFDQHQQLIVDRETMITDEIALKIIQANHQKVEIRTPLYCEVDRGVCQKCFGNFNAYGKIVKMHEPVGVVAAQSISEPGTQLTMRTFHTGGVASAADITQGLPRVKELFDVTKLNGRVASISDVDGIIADIRHLADGTHEIIIETTQLNTTNKTEEKYQKLFLVDHNALIRVKKGEKIKIGAKLIDGNVNLNDLLRVAGPYSMQRYFFKEIQRVYRAQGITISNQYIEVVLHKMMNKLKIYTPGNSKFTPGELVTIFKFKAVNRELLLHNKIPAYGEPVIYGINSASIRNNWLGSISFQDTTRGLIKAAVKSEVDHLLGLKENVIVGNQIPCGTGSMSRPEIIEAGKKSYNTYYNQNIE